MFFQFFIQSQQLYIYQIFYFYGSQLRQTQIRVFFTLLSNKSIFFLFNIKQYLSMEPQNEGRCLLTASPRTSRGEPSFLEVSSTHLLFFNGSTVFLKPIDQKYQILHISHNCPVTAAKFSYGYKHIASIDEKGTLLIHEFSPNKLFLAYTYQGFYVGAKSIDWTSDNKRICVVGSGKTKFGRVALVEAGTDVGEITGVSAQLTTASFRPERPFKLAVGGSEFAFKFYEGPPYKFVSSKKEHTNFINQIKYSPDGKKVVSVSSDKKIILYDGSTGQMIKSHENAHGGGITGADWIDNQTFVTVSSDKKIKKWSTSFQLIAELQSSQNPGQLALIDTFVTSVAYCRQYERLFFTLLSGEIKETDKNLSKIVRSSQTYRNKPFKILTKNGSQDVAILDNDGKILRYNIKTNQVFRLNRNKLVYGKFIVDGCISFDTLYVLGNEDTIFALKFQNGQQKYLTKVEGTILLAPLCSKVSGFIAFTNNDFKVYIQKQVKVQKFGEAKLNHPPTFVKVVNSTHESELVLVGNAKSQIQIYRISHSVGAIKIQKIIEFSSNTYKISCIQLNNDVIFTGDSMGGIKAWKWTQSQNKIQLLQTMGTHTTLITSIIAYKDKLYTFSFDNKYSIWNLEKLNRITTLVDVHKQGILSAGIVGESLLTCGGDLLVKQRKL